MSKHLKDPKNTLDTRGLSLETCSRKKVHHVYFLYFTKAQYFILIVGGHIKKLDI